MSKAERRAQLIARAREIQNTADADNDGNGRDLTAEELAELNQCLADAETLRAEIEADEARAQSRAALEAAEASLQTSTRRSSPVDPTTAPQPTSPTTTAEVVGPAFANDPQRGFASLGEFGQAVATAYRPGSSGFAGDERLAYLATVSRGPGVGAPRAAATGASIGVDSDGGLLVPPAYSRRVYDAMVQVPGNLMSECDTYTFPEKSLTMPAIAETSRKDGSRWGGIVGRWKGEAEQMTGSKPKLRDMTLEPHALYVLCYATDDLLNSPAALDQWLFRGARDEITFKVNDAIVEGTGNKQPVGYKGHPATIVIAKEAAQPAATIVAANINKMWSRFFAPMRAGASWKINQDCEPTLDGMEDSANRPMYLPAGGIADTPQARLKGRRVQEIEYAETVGTVGDISLVNLRAYALGLRGSLDFAMSMHLRFDYAETAFRWIFWADGQPWILDPITPFKGAGGGNDTLSPFVQLATRA